MQPTDLAHLLPEYPLTPHLPIRPNISHGDRVATAQEAACVLHREVVVEEKIDGANVGLTFADDNLIVRNRNHILKKGYTARTEAKKQFSSLWGYGYRVRDQILQIHQKVGSPVGLYGEWLVIPHGTLYEFGKLRRDPFVGFALYCPIRKTFLDPFWTRSLLTGAGFRVPDLLATRIDRLEDLLPLTTQTSRLGPTLREGVVVKCGDGERTTGRFKMVREGFVPGRYFS